MGAIPERSIELNDLLLALQSISRRYQKYAKDLEGPFWDDGAKLFVTSVKPGSLDITLLPELYDVGKHAVGVAAAVGPKEIFEGIFGFGKSIATLVERFKSKPDPEDVTVRDCDDAINIVKPIAQAGGEQKFFTNQVNGTQILVVNLDSGEAENVWRNAAATKALLKFPETERVTGVALTWKTFDRSEARTEGQRSPDKGIIESLDPRPKAVLFGDDEAGLKADILAGDENPMQMIYYVDVEISRVDGRIKAYKIVGYDSKEPLDDDG